jgi:electron transport complex protein RnfD
MAETGRRQDRLQLAVAPHYRTSLSAPGMAWLVAACLLPASAWGILVFGPAAAWVLLTAVGAAVAAEALTTVPFGRFTLGDGSAVVTGLLVGMCMPAGVPLGVPAAASLFAIVVVKQTFGGLGRNWMNPAMGGVLFALISWGASMGSWLPLPSGAALPPLDSLRAALASGAAPAGGPLAVLNAGRYPFSGVDAAVVSWINARLPGFLAPGLQRGTFDILIGNVVGPLGAVSAPLLGAGGALLAARGIIRWETPVAYLGVFFVLSLVLGGQATGQGWLGGGPLFHVLSGTLFLGAFFAASDPVTSPLSRRGRWVYGIVLGVLTFLLRSFGSIGDGVVVSIALGNALVPLIDTATLRRAPGASAAPARETPPGAAP